MVNPRVGGHGDRAQALALAVAEQASIGAPLDYVQRTNRRPLTAGFQTMDL